MTFAELNLAPSLLKAVTDCGYTAPTPIQEESIPAALAGRDLLANAQTGTGKTAAFMLPALQLLTVPKRMPKGTPRILVLTPTRELASQVLDATRTYGRYLKLRSATLLGGMPYRPQFDALAQPIDLVVATPGRLIDHLDRRSIDLSQVEILILDEADRMLDMGFKEAVETITAATPAARQTLFFTATLDQAMAKLAMKLLKDPVRVEIGAQTTISEQIEQRLHLTDNLFHKQQLLQHLVADQQVHQAIIFSATKRDADTLAKSLSSQGHRAAALHGDMNQAARNRTLRDLRRGHIRLLVATDVAARGIDVTTISHVINFDLPKFAEDYVHRIGRTGRAGAAGTAISFVSGADRDALQRIQHYLGRTLPRYIVPGLEPTVTLEAKAKAPARRPGPPARGQRRPGSNERPGNPGQRPGTRSAAPAPRSRREPVVEYRKRSR